MHALTAQGYKLDHALSQGPRASENVGESPNANIERGGASDLESFAEQKYGCTQEPAKHQRKWPYREPAQGKERHREGNEALQAAKAAATDPGPF